MKRVLGLLAVAVLALTGCGGNAATQLEDGKLTVGMECDYAPYNWTTTKEQAGEFAVPIKGSTGYCDGYDVMIASKVAKDLGVDLEVKKIAWDGLIPALQSNEIDVIIAGMSPTNERRQTIDFSDPYYRDEPTMSVVVNKNTKFVGAKELKDLDGAKISAQLGTLHVDLLDQINGESANPLPDYSALIQATVSGTIDGYIAEYVVAEEQAKQNKNLSLITFPQGKGFVMDENEITSAIGMKKDSGDFLKAINASLAKISGDERESLMKEATSRSEA